MSDRNDFDFEDDFLSDDNEPFDFDEEEGFPSGLGDEFESDMPEIEEEIDERGPNRTFVFLAGIMILLFVVALVAVLFLATRPTGPSDLELTASQVVMLNLTVESQMAETSTQNALDFSLTQTAAAWTPTPSETLSPTPSEVRPTVTPTPSEDLTLQANAQLAAGVLTLTALAGNVTVTPTETLSPPTAAPTEIPTEAPVSLDLRSAFATQVQFATQQGQFDQESFSTRVSAATQIADAILNPETELNLRNQLESTQTALDDSSAAVQTAIAFIDSELQVRGNENQALATQLALIIPAGLQTQAALGTPQAVATVGAQQTQAALATLSSDFNRSTPGVFVPEAPSNAKLLETGLTRGDLATQVAMLPVDQANETATAAVLATRESFATQAAVSTRGMILTQAAGATQQAFMTPPVFATQAAIATQVSLATRQALIDLALGVIATPVPNGGGIEAVNQTATAIAGAFLTATAQAFTPGAVTTTAVPAQAFPTAVVTGLPRTGLFDDVVGGGRNGMGILALAVFGLVGVIFVSRRLRVSNDRAVTTEEVMPDQPLDVPQDPPTEA